MKSKAYEFIGALICPHKCAGCGEVLNLFSEDFDPSATFCPKCRAEWERAKILPCKTCRLAAIECSCVPDVLQDVPVASVFKFGTVASADRLIYLIKRKRLPRVYDFVADELARRIISFSRERDIDLSNSIITYGPRKRNSIIRYGFDHGRTLAEAVAEKLQIPACKTLRRRGNGRDQKKLTKEQRMMNSSNRFVFLKKADVKGKTVIIIDDVITTGATVASCVMAIYENEPEKIVVLCLAKGNKTEKEKN